MAAAKCASQAGQTVPGSSVVSLISRNGTDIGVQLAGLPGRWFTGPAAPVQDALLREGYTEADAALDIGDSAVIETIGLGGMAVAAAPTVASFFGGTAADTAARVREMAEICVARSQRFTLAPLDGVGTPVGIDAPPGRGAGDHPPDHHGRAAQLQRRGPDRRGHRPPAGAAVPRRHRRARGRAGRRLSMRAVLAGPAARRALARSATGAVEVPLRRGAYLRLDDELLMVVPHRAPVGPLTLLVAGLGEPGWDEGAPARVDGDTLVVAGARIDLSGARPWDAPDPGPLRDGWRAALGAAVAAVPVPGAALAPGLDALAAGDSDAAAALLAGLGEGSPPPATTSCAATPHGGTPRANPWRSPPGARPGPPR